MKWLVVIALLAACNTELENSTLSLLIMDAPPKNVTSVQLQIARIEVHVEESAVDGRAQADGSIDLDDKWHSFAVNKPLDLAAAQSETGAISLGDLFLPDGRISQIRLILDASKPSIAVVDGKSCELGMTKLPPTGIKINHPFKSFHVGKNLLHKVWVDVPLDQMLVQTKTCFDLKPVLRIAKFQTAGKTVSIN